LRLAAGANTLDSTGGMSTSDLKSSPHSLDAEAVGALVELLGGDAEALAEIVAACLEEGQLRVVELREGAAAGDAVLVGRAAHTLKANAATFGAVRLEQLCRELEQQARGGDLGGAVEQVESIGAEWLAVHPLLVALRGTDS
jgi:HPt (histidine-containing phosphotransfer) domain-containing protein